MRIRAMLAFAVLVPVVLLCACSDDDPATPAPDPDVLVTITFDDYGMVRSPGAGWVFASDTDGDVLDLAAWDATSQVVLRNADVHPDTIAFTLVQESGFSLVLSTRLGVPAGSAATFSGSARRTIGGTATVTFLNAPPCERYRFVGDGFGVDGGADFPASDTFFVRGEATDLFIRIDPVGGDPVGGWLPDLRVGDADTLDFASSAIIAPLEPRVIGLPGGGDRGLCRVSGVLRTDPLGMPMALDQALFDGPVPGSVTLYPSALDPARLVTEFYQEMPTTPRTVYYQAATGPVPEALANLDGDLVVTSTSPDGTVFTASFAWDQMVAAWFQDVDRTISTWRVSGPGTVRSFVLPALPVDIAVDHPMFPRGGFVLRNLELYQATSANLVRSQGKVFDAAASAGPDPAARREAGLAAWARTVAPGSR